MKPRWAYIWEYTDLESGERRRTFLPVTADEFFSCTGQFLPDSNARALEETKVDRDLVPLRTPPGKRIPKMPDFDVPTDDELRALWRKYRGEPDVERLILEIVTLRKSLQKIRDRYDVTERCTQDKGDLGDANGRLLRLYHLLRAEMTRAGML
ncbi:hypothetical protein [Burkholderia sp. PU8-34]